MRSERGENKEIMERKGDKKGMVNRRQGGMYRQKESKEGKGK